MAFQFPPSPIIGQEYTPSAGITFRWNGTAWYLVNTQFITQGEADALYIALTQKAAVDGVATLDAGAQVPLNQLTAHNTDAAAHAAATNLEWQGAAKFVDAGAPTAGDGVDGDIWFQYE
jgi:hypothetical protein